MKFTLEQRKFIEQLYGQTLTLQERLDAYEERRRQEILAKERRRQDKIAKKRARDLFR